MSDTNTTEQLRKAMLQPKKVEVDNKKVEQHSLDEVIAMDRYVEAKKALGRRNCGIRFSKLESGGGVK